MQQSMYYCSAPKCCLKRILSVLPFSPNGAGCGGGQDRVDRVRVPPELVQAFAARKPVHEDLRGGDVSSLCTCFLHVQNSSVEQRRQVSSANAQWPKRDKRNWLHSSKMKFSPNALHIPLRFPRVQWGCEQPCGDTAARQHRWPPSRSLAAARR